jgi:predicted RNA-binding protein with RPS1 domain/tetratricopeptide (TPR) repeat protein
LHWLATQACVGAAGQGRIGIDVTEESQSTMESATETDLSPQDLPLDPPEASNDAVKQTVADGEDDDGPADRREGSPRPELLQLVDLAAKYPEIGPPLAQLAFKIGQPEFGNQIVRMGLDKEGPGLEYYFVVAHSARRQRRYAEARKLSVDAIEAFLRTADDELASDDGERLLHLIRLGFSTLLFDEKDPKGDLPFIERLREALPRLAPRLSSEAFFHALLAQTLWYDDIEASEQAWDRAAELDTTEATWNARGTWYKDAQGDLDKAEQAYRQGLQIVPTSPLLLHNLGQLLVESARRLLHEAEPILRAALREESPKGLRRHVHSTRDRLMAFRASLPPRAPRKEEPEPQREPVVGEVLKGKVRSLTAFGAFVVLPECGTGLLHKSELAHEPIDDPAQLLQVGEEVEVKVLEVERRDGKLRIALSRKALLPRPEAAPPPATQRPRHEGRPDGQQGHHPRREDPRDRKGGPRRGPDDRTRPRQGKPKDDDKFASLGEMLLAKMNQQKKT